MKRVVSSKRLLEVIRNSYESLLHETTLFSALKLRQYTKIESQLQEIEQFYKEYQAKREDPKP